MWHQIHLNWLVSVAKLMPKIELFSYSTSYPMVLLWFYYAFWEDPQTKTPIWGGLNRGFAQNKFIDCLLPAPRRIMSAWADAPMLTWQNKQLIHGSPRTAHSAEFQMKGKQHGKIHLKCLICLKDYLPCLDVYLYWKHEMLNVNICKYVLLWILKKDTVCGILLK